MNRSRWTVLVLVLIALGVSLGYGLKGHGSNDSNLAPLREAANLQPCPTSLSPSMPDLTLQCLGGGKDVKVRGAGTGKPTLVNIYASWCGPCQKEMPVLKAFYDKAKDQVALVGVDTEDPPQALGLRFATAMQQHWPAVFDEERRIGAHYSTGIPITLFFAADGTLKHVENKGGYSTLAQLEKDVRTYLGVTL